MIHHLNVTHSHIRNGFNYFVEGGYPFSSGIKVYIYCHTSIRIVFVLMGNQAENGGNFAIEYIGTDYQWTVLIFILNSELLNGNSSAGGGLFLAAVVGDSKHRHSLTNYNPTFLTVENTHFGYNTASFDGAAVYLRPYQNAFVQVGRITFREGCTFSPALNIRE